MSAELITEFLNSMPYMPRTKEKYAYLLARIESECGEIKNLSADQYRRYVTNTNSASYRWAFYSAVRAYLRFTVGDHHPLFRIKIKKPGMTPQRSMNHDQVKAILEDISNSRSRLAITKAKAIRDKAIALLMLDTGLRVSEVCNLELHYIDLESCQASAIVKGGNWHTVLFSLTTQESLKAWLSIRYDHADQDVTSLFVSIGGDTRGMPMTRAGLGVTVRRWGIKSNVGVISPHDFRRTFAVFASQNGAPEQILMRAGGWSNSEMIKRYTQNLTIKDFENYLPVNSI